MLKEVAEHEKVFCLVWSWQKCFPLLCLYHTRRGCLCAIVWWWEELHCAVMRRTLLRVDEKKTIVVDERKTLWGSFALPWGGKSSAIGNLRSISFLFPDTEIICAYIMNDGNNDHDNCEMTTMTIRPVHKNLFLEFPKYPSRFMLHFDI